MLTVLTGDAIEQLRTLPDESVQCCVTSPPYWGLRDYGTAAWEGGDEGCDHANPKAGKPTWGPGTTQSSTLQSRSNNDSHEREGFKGAECPKCGAKRIDSQLGLEKTPEEYVAKMVAVFREVRRVLRRDGTLWLNLGDSYAASSGTGGTNSFQPKQPMFTYSRAAPMFTKPKDLCGIPWRVAFALQADGWWLRSDIIWAKPNPMPESVTDRPTKSHEYLFLLTKASSYYYDSEAIREQVKESQDGSIRAIARDRSGPVDIGNGAHIAERVYDRICGANKRSVWTVATAPYPEAHFATYPPDLIKPCIMAGTSAKGCCAKCGAPWERVVDVERSPRGDRFGNRDGAFDRGQAGSAYQQITATKTLGWQPTCKCESSTISCTVLDPFAGSGTTGMVALELGRKAVLIELNPAYVKLIEQRCNVTMGLALT